MNAPPSPTSHPLHAPPRVMPNAVRAFGGIWRLTSQRFFTPGHWLVLVGMLSVLALLAVGASSTALRATRYLNWVCGFYVCFLVPTIAFISAAGTIRDDLKSSSVDYVFTRPVRRWAFVVFRFLAHVACAQIDFLLALAVILTVGVVVGAPNPGPALPLLLLAQVIAIITFSAFGFLCGMLTSRYVIVGLVYGAVVEVGVGSVPTQLNRISMIRHLTEMLTPLSTDVRMGMGGPALAQSLSVPAAVAVLLVIAVAMLAVTAVVFTIKEPAAAAGREA
jgi:ABC-type transport system involved in multi-copper enzyme maturation permease subunit